jgi:asparagine synthase (glutamine-hydrolysing)
MAGSIEGRYPYLDHTLVEFANRLPPAWKIRGLIEKHILRRALADLLPNDIARRTKQPYRAPDSASFFVDGRPLDYVEDLFSADSLRASGLFDVGATTRLFAKARAGRAIGFADNQAFVGILSTLLLLRSPLGTVQGPYREAAAGSSRSSLPSVPSVSR